MKGLIMETETMTQEQRERYFNALSYHTTETKGKKESDYISIVLSSIVHPKKNEIEAFMFSIGYKKAATTGMGGGKVQMHFRKDVQYE